MKASLSELKDTYPSKWYQMAKQIGAVNQTEKDDLRVEALSGLDDQESAELVAQHFASISQEYLPFNTANLPAFLPPLPPPRVKELEVYKRLKNLKKTKSTQSIDLPHKLRKEFAAELAGPVTNILNASLQQHKYPTMWKQEWVTPVPKVRNPKTISELRKI